MNKIFKLIILLFLVVSIKSTAQKNYKQGYLITLGNDTLRQQIAYRSDKKNYVSCKVKSNGEIQKYKPSEINGFGFKNDKYYSSVITDGIFVKLLVQNDLSLYRSKKDFYLYRNGKTYWLKSNEDDLTIYRDKNYEWKGKMIFLTDDCEGFSENLTRRLKLNEEELIILVKSYNDCIKED
jgi:hypothetical protein